MKVTKWVDMGQEVEVDITAEDIRCALSEAFSNVTNDRLGEEKPTAHDVKRTINSIAQFLNALTDEHIALCGDSVRKLAADYLRKAAGRFDAPEAAR